MFRKYVSYGRPAHDVICGIWSPRTNECKAKLNQLPINVIYVT